MDEKTKYLVKRNPSTGFIEMYNPNVNNGLNSKQSPKKPNKKASPPLVKAIFKNFTKLGLFLKVKQEFIKKLNKSPNVNPKKLAIACKPIKLRKRRKAKK